MRRAAAAAAAAQAQAQQQHQQITHTSRCRQSFMLRARTGKETEPELGLGRCLSEKQAAVSYINIVKLKRQATQ